MTALSRSKKVISRVGPRSRTSRPPVEARPRPPDCSRARSRHPWAACDADRTGSCRSCRRRRAHPRACTSGCSCAGTGAGGSRRRRNGRFESPWSPPSASPAFAWRSRRARGRRRGRGRRRRCQRISAPSSWSDLESHRLCRQREAGTTIEASFGARVKYTGATQGRLEGYWRRRRPSCRGSSAGGIVENKR